DVTLSRYDYIRRLRGDGGLPEHWALPEMGGQVLPPLGPRPGQVGKVPPEAGPQSLSPDIDRAAEQRRRAEQQLREGAVRHAPNEVVVPLGAGRQLGAPDAASRSGATDDEREDGRDRGRRGGRDGGASPSPSPFQDPTFPMINGGRASDVGGLAFALRALRVRPQQPGAGGGRDGGRRRSVDRRGDPALGHRRTRPDPAHAAGH